MFLHIKPNIVIAILDPTHPCQIIFQEKEKRKQSLYPESCLKHWHWSISSTLAPKTTFCCKNTDLAIGISISIGLDSKLS